jgi:hypothetical protein
MKKIFFALSGLSLLACAATATAGDEATYPTCISFAPAGYCDGMEFDSKTNATWHNYDCAGSQGAQTRAKYKTGRVHTFCDGRAGCQPAAVNGWDSFTWRFNLAASTGTLTGMIGGSQVTLQQDIPVAITQGACDFARTQGGVSSLSQ